MSLASPNRVRIGILSALASDDRESSSGSPWSMAHALERHAGEVVYLGPTRPLALYAGAAVDRIARAALHRRYDYRHSLVVARRYGRYFERAIRRERVDVVFAPKAAAEAAYLRSDVPLIYYSDATPARLIGYYPEWRHVLRVSLLEAHRIERKAIGRATALVYPTQWVADSAIETYGADPGRINVFGPGPNLWPLPDRDSLPARSPSTDDCRLLFLGASWERKGGRIALEAQQELRRRGVAATLTIVGVEPPNAAGMEGVRVLGRLRKNVPEERELLEQTLLTSHFLVLPTRAECFSIAICEAAAFGLPAFATATGGVPGVLRDGVNGYALPLEASGVDYADTIGQVLDAPERYRSLAEGSRAFHEEYLSWDAWGRSMGELIAELLGRGELAQV